MERVSTDSTSRVGGSNIPPIPPRDPREITQVDLTRFDARLTIPDDEREYYLVFEGEPTQLLSAGNWSVELRERRIDPPQPN